MDKKYSSELSSQNSTDTQDIMLFKKMGININSKRFKLFSNVDLLKIKDEAFALEVQAYWEKYYNRKIDPILNLAFMNLTGKRETRILPSGKIRKEILSFFNDVNMREGYVDKNIYDKLINKSNAVNTVLKRVHGSYFDSNNNYVSSENANVKLLKCRADLIIKPSRSNNGVGVERLEFKNEEIYLNQEVVTIYDLEHFYQSDFIIQEMIQQHSLMAAPHPTSVNTLRMVTFRWQGEIRYLLTFARFGANDNVKDNAGAGGLCLGVKDSGEFMDSAIDENCRVYTHHPTTNYCFANSSKIPNFEDFKTFVIKLHKDIIHHDLISWDIAVGKDAQPIFIEANFSGAIWIYQMATQRPLFGDLTEEVLQYVSNEYKTRNTKSARLKLRDKNKKLESENRKLKSKNQKLKFKLKSKEK